MFLAGYTKPHRVGLTGYGTRTKGPANVRDLYTFNVDSVMSYELGGEESQLPIPKTNLFTASADDILSRMGKVRPQNNIADYSWSYYAYRYLRG
jgi:hypothetical protein